MNAHSAATTTFRAAPVVLRRPLATARPGLDYLRAAFVAQWEAAGAAGAGELAGAFLRASAGTPEADTDHAAVARWVLRLHHASPRLAASAS